MQGVVVVVLTAHLSFLLMVEQLWGEVGVVPPMAPPTTPQGEVSVVPLMTPQGEVSVVPPMAPQQVCSKQLLQEDHLMSARVGRWRVHYHGDQTAQQQALRCPGIWFVFAQQEVCLRDDDLGHLRDDEGGDHLRDDDLGHLRDDDLGHLRDDEGGDHLRDDEGGDHLRDDDLGGWFHLVAETG